MSEKGLARTITITGILVVCAWACSSGTARRDKNYGTDTGASYVPDDGSAITPGHDGAAADQGHAGDGASERATDGARDATTDATTDDAATDSPPGADGPAD